MEDSRSGICTRCIPEGSGRRWRWGIAEEKDDDDDNNYNTSNKGHAPDLSARYMITLNGKSQTSY